MRSLGLEQTNGGNNQGSIMQASSRAVARLPSLVRPSSAAAGSLAAGPKVTFHFSAPTFEDTPRSVSKPGKLLPLTASSDPITPFDKTAPVAADADAATAQFRFDMGLTGLPHTNGAFTYHIKRLLATGNMVLLDGRSVNELRSQLRGPWEVDRALALVESSAEALAAKHERDSGR